MAEVFANLVYETSLSTGTGPLELEGAMDGHRTFVDGIGDGNECLYMVTNGNYWEVLKGTLTAGTPSVLTHTAVEDSSAGGAKIDWVSGQKKVAQVLSADYITSLVTTEDSRLSDSRTPEEHGNEAHTSTFTTAAEVVSAVNAETSLSVNVTGDANTVDDQHASAFAPASEGVSNGDAHNHAGGDGAQIDHGNLSGVGASDHHSRYTDAEAVAAVNAETSLSVNVTGDADTVDGQHASAFAPASEGVSNGDAHDHHPSDYGQVAHSSLSSVGASDHHSRYTDAEAQSALDGHIHNNTISGNAGLSDPGNSPGRVLFPGGAKYESSTVTGTIKVRFPMSWDNAMIYLTIRVYEYSSHASFTVHCGGYTQVANSTWYRQFATITGSPNGSSNHTVRFGHDGTKACIWIGETDTSWSYPKVSVSEVVVGYGGNLADYVDGWSVTVESAFDTIKRTISNTRIGIRHADFVDVSGSNTDVNTSGSTIIDNFYTDDKGHLTSVGTRTLNHNDLANRGASDHHSRYTDSEALSAAEAGATDSATANKLMRRNSSGDVWCRLFRSTYTGTNSDIAAFYTTQSIGGDFMRPSTPYQVAQRLKSAILTISTSNPSGGQDKDVWYTV